MTTAARAFAMEGMEIILEDYKIEDNSNTMDWVDTLEEEEL